MNQTTSVDDISAKLPKRLHITAGGALARVRRHLRPVEKWDPFGHRSN